jgi:hypothetical protein
MPKYPGPLPNSDFRRQVASEVMAPLVGSISGEITTSSRLVLGTTRYKGRVTDVVMSVLNAGKNDATVPTLTGNVRINGTTIFSTQPVIAHVSGEAAQQKTTHTDAADTGITAHVINESANTFSPGDVIVWDALYSGNTGPTTKMNNASVLVEVEPYNP